jgi:hypothetical protein
MMSDRPPISSCGIATSSSQLKQLLSEAQESYGSAYIKAIQDAVCEPRHSGSNLKVCFATQASVMPALPDLMHHTPEEHGTPTE